MQYRGHNLADFWNVAEFEDITYLLVWGHWPSADEKEALRKELAGAAQNVPESVVNVIQAFPCVQLRTDMFALLILRVGKPPPQCR